ncbi:MAG: hypothetical protein M1825_001451 [Sarcosagium campestre]|nr:MAG: hypothetical protein M1825_001451 [Sarcosagium campestre]
MTDITKSFVGCFETRHGPLTLYQGHPWPRSDEFLKEAYRIYSHVSSLRAYLKSIRQSYLSTAPPPRRTQLSDSIQPQERERRYLSESQREQIDAECKQLLRELNATIRNLSDAEQLRQNTEGKLAARRHGARGLRTLGKWAAGGTTQSKSPEEEMEEARSNGVKVHRENVLWYLRRKLEECGELQRSMMETRLIREVEKSKSILYKTRGSAGLPAHLADGGAELGDWSKGQGDGRSAPGQKNSRLSHVEDAEKSQIEQQLSAEQLQLFAEENQDMLKHYEDTLDQVRTAERSLIEISELQTTLTYNLATQSAHIDQLTTDALNTSENVGGGNKQLKRAAERKSTAKYVFYGSCAFSLFLITWDLLI